MNETVIRVENLSKRYVIGHQRDARDGLRHRLEDALRNPLRWLLDRKRKRQATREEFWALKDVSFDVKQGDVVGIIGRNGAGKSTLLKILSRITEPTNGRIRIRGRVASLLEVGTGFHQELTGRENIFLNGAILGMSKIEIKRKFDEIVAFSEIEKFLDTPVKRYSSGMYVRLAFAVAAHLEPEILIVDEVLAVGDIEFQRKCLGRMSEVARGGRTVLFVSHNMIALKALCSRAILLEGGRFRETGTPEQVIASYIRNRGMGSLSTMERKDREGSGLVRVESVRILGPDGHEVLSVLAGQPAIFEVSYRAKTANVKMMASVDIGSTEGSRVTTLWSALYDAEFQTQLAGKLYCRINELTLRPGDYSVNVGLMSRSECFDFIRDVMILRVDASDFYGSGRLPASDHGPLMSRFRWSDAAIP